MIKNYNFQLEIIVGGCTVDPKKNRILEGSDEADRKGVHLSVGPLLDIVVVPDQARFGAPFVSNRL